MCYAAQAAFTAVTRVDMPCDVCPDVLQQPLGSVSEPTCSTRASAVLCTSRRVQFSCGCFCDTCSCREVFLTCSSCSRRTSACIRCTSSCCGVHFTSSRSVASHQRLWSPHQRLWWFSSTPAPTVDFFYDPVYRQGGWVGEGALYRHTGSEAVASILIRCILGSDLA